MSALKISALLRMPPSFVIVIPFHCNLLRRMNRDLQISQHLSTLAPVFINAPARAGVTREITSSTPVHMVRYVSR